MAMISESNPAQILVVDDVSSNRDLVKRILRSNEYDVFEAEDGEKALNIIKTKKFDAVLLDIMLPGINGYEVLKHLRNQADYKLLPVILISSLATPDDVAQGFAAGATDYVRKPFNLVELEARVRAVVEHKRTIDRLDDTESVLFSLARMVEARDEHNGNHCDRLAHMSVMFGKKLGLDYEQLEALRRGGVLHDIGNVGIPDSILLKKGKLTEAEWSIIKQHPFIGSMLCAPLRTMRLTLDIVRSHHERWDGSGYPQGLSGEDIPLLARVFQFVDVYDALCSERPYKSAYSREKAIETIATETANGCCDPAVAKEFIELVKYAPEVLELPEHYTQDRSAQILDDMLKMGMLDWYLNKP